RAGFIEWNDGDIAGEGLDQLVQPGRFATLGAVAQLGHGDRADAKLRWPVLEDSRADIPPPAQSEADAIRIQHELERHAKGSFILAILRERGRRTGSLHAPRISRNSAVHSSAGSRMMRFPTRCARTSFCWSGKRHDFGSRTAWLPPL